MIFPMPDPHDPRVFFAAERTLLAWLRTSLAVMGFGFLIARFGLYLRMMADHPINPTHRLTSTVIGAALVVLGVLAAGVSAWQHAAFIRALPKWDRPRMYWTGFALFFAIGLTLLGGVLAAYLVVWMNEA
jgi:putative membrane protein